MGRCARLKFNRRKLGLSQKEFAERVGLSIGTISRLETDETTWETIQDATFDKINSIFESERLGRIITVNGHEEHKENVEEKTKKVEEEKESVWADKVETGLKYKKRSIEDNATLKVLEIIMDGLRKAESHEEFEANLKLLKRLMKDD